MMVATRRVHSLAGLAAVLGLHACFLYLLSIEQAGTEKAAATRYSQLRFILPPLPKPAMKIPEPARIPVVKPPREKTMTEATPIESPSLPPPETVPAIAAADPFDESIRFNIDSLVKQAGKADREARPANETQAYGPASGSMEAVMTRAFTEARLAVPLKWYEAARISEFSAPGARKPIYQVRPHLGPIAFITLTS
ncbi:hypothetical protein [Pseudoduganella umbonata]|uniref:Uncharacterized protein n=1 Tax=Pseudoduganella umbonata TaxID=864828 RepID=A0A4P8HP64_9BURK|nr:hypothetical protein [Pseudoduganella umbonata]MBB3225033.1 hypothetical protein [Pseudoduganella umbonata]QCP11489.1 hypothetical protein FCL38_14465 [Pseudoduganella umbonata]